MYKNDIQKCIGGLIILLFSLPTARVDENIETIVNGENDMIRSTSFSFRSSLKRSWFPFGLVLSLSFGLVFVSQSLRPSEAASFLEDGRTAGMILELDAKGGMVWNDLDTQAVKERQMALWRTMEPVVAHRVPDIGKRDRVERFGKLATFGDIDFSIASYESVRDSR